MLVDALNLFIRNFIVDPSLSISGNPLGGVKGSLKSLQKLMRVVKPDEIIIVWDGPGGSKKKKMTFKEYKDGRKPIRLNRSIEGMTEDQELQNKVWQQFRLFEYLNQVPVIQALEQDIEADDLIAFIRNCPKYTDWAKIIVSSDKDFIQLLDDKTMLYRPIQDEVKTWKTVVAEYGIHPLNFALARALAGDKSDNIDGVRGIGLKTVAKNLPFLAESKTHLIDEVEEYCKKKIEEKSKLKFFQSFVDNIDTIKLNYSIMQLYAPQMSVQVAQKMRFVTENFVPELNLTNFKKMMNEDGFGDFNFDEMCLTFRRFVKDHKTESENV